MDFILKYYNEIMSVIAVGNGVLLVFYWYSVNKLKKTLGLRSKGKSKIATDDNDRARPVPSSEVAQALSIATVLSSVYNNATSLFPLFGILGTVLSLIPINESSAVVSELFGVALSSTAIGVIYAIFYKGIGSVPSGILDYCTDIALTRIKPPRENITVVSSRNADNT